MREIILSCKNKSELCIKMGIHNNGKGMHIINDLLEKYDMINFFNNKIKYDKNPKLCKNCGNKIEYEKRDNNFCNNSCSALYNNVSRKRTESSKNKTSLSLMKYHQNVNSNDKITEFVDKVCPICKNIFSIRNIKKETKRKYCSKQCSLEGMKKNVSISQKLRVANGTHKGWSSRNIESYPETFFKQVLKNNNLEDKYIFNYPINKRKDLGIDETYNYFLDFYFIDSKILLEIDGKQHNYRKQHDELRDSRLESIGIKIYRIKWKSINTEKGKEYIKNEIDKFLDFYYKNGDLVQSARIGVLQTSDNGS